MPYLVKRLYKDEFVSILTQNNISTNFATLNEDSVIAPMVDGQLYWFTGSGKEIEDFLTRFVKASVNFAKSEGLTCIHLNYVSNPDTSLRLYYLRVRTKGIKQFFETFSEFLGAVVKPYHKKIGTDLIEFDSMTNLITVVSKVIDDERYVLTIVQRFHGSPFVVKIVYKQTEEYMKFSLPARFVPPYNDIVLQGLLK